MRRKESTTKAIPEEEEFEDTKVRKDFAALGELSEERAGRVLKKIMRKVKEESAANSHHVTISTERLALLEKMEDAAQDMAEYVFQFFKNKDLDARKHLILRAAEVLRTNPSAGPGVRDSGALTSSFLNGL